MFIGVDYTLNQMDNIKQYTPQAPPPQEQQHLHIHGYRHIRLPRHQRINIIIAKYHAHLFILQELFGRIAIYLKLA